MRHTPGPWKIKFVSQDGCSIQNWFELCNHQTANEFVMEAEPNRRLIEAAPEMLDALRDCVGLIEASERDFGMTIQDAAQKEACLTAIRILKLKVLSAIAKTEEP